MDDSSFDERLNRSSFPSPRRWVPFECSSRKEDSLASLLLGLEVSLFSEGKAPSILWFISWLTEDGDFVRPVEGFSTKELTIHCELKVVDPWIGREPVNIASDEKDAKLDVDCLGPVSLAATDGPFGEMAPEASLRKFVSTRLGRLDPGLPLSSLPPFRSIHPNWVLEGWKSVRTMVEMAHSSVLAHRPADERIPRVTQRKLPFRFRHEAGTFGGNRSRVLVDVRRSLAYDLGCHGNNCCAPG